MELILLYILALVIPMIASANIKSTYTKYKKIDNKKKLSGFEVARKVLDANGLKDMYIVEVSGNLTDHYDPNQKVVRLSTDIFHGETIAMFTKPFAAWRLYRSSPVSSPTAAKTSIGRTDGTSAPSKLPRF